MKKITLFIITFSSLLLVGAKTPPKKKSQKPQEKITTVAHRLNLLRSEGLTAMDVQNYRKAEQIFKEILTLKPEEWLDEKEYNEIIIYLARAEVKIKQLSDAENHLSLLLDKGLQDEVVYNRDVLTAQIQYAKGHLKEAILTLHTLIDRFSLQEWDLEDQKFYMRVKGDIDKYYEDLFTQAEKCFEGQIYEETIPLYEEILNALNSGEYRQDRYVKLPYQVRSRLAYCAFHAQKYKKAREILIETKKNYTSLFEPDCFYLLILSCKELKNYDEALSFCQECSTFKYNFLKEEPVRFEIARLQYIKGKKEEAKELFEDLIGQLSDPAFVRLSRFYLAKILIDERNYLEVEKVLHPDYFNFEEDDILKSEWAFMRAEAFYHRKQYEMAIAGFKESLTHPGVQKAKWYDNALYNLGFSYLKLGEDRLLQAKSKEELFSLAENIFTKLIQKEDSDRAYLALGRAYLMKFYYLKDEDAREKICSIFKSYSFKELDAKLEAGIILADMAQEPGREKIYDSLCSTDYQEAKNYGKAFYYRGVYYSQKSVISGDDRDLLEAVSSFKEGYAKLNKNYPNLALASVKHALTAYLNASDTRLYYEGFEYIDDFLENEQKDSKLKKALEDLHYLKAEICLKIMQTGDVAFFEKGVKVAEQILKNTKEKERALFLKARLHFQNKDFETARKVYEELYQLNPSSPYAGESLFWLAECIDSQNSNKALAKQYRQKVYQDYPQCKLSPEAYFLTYSFAEYLEGEKEKLEHLKKFQSHFEDSPYLIASEYLIGLSERQAKKDPDGRVLSEKNLKEALKRFTSAQEIYLKLYEAKKIPKGNLKYFTSIYYQSLLSCAQIYLEKADESQGAKRQIYLEKALEHFDDIYKDFTEVKKPFTKVLFEENVYPNIFEEACFGRALTFGKTGKIPEAEEALSEIIEQYAHMKISHAHYLSRAWYELAMISMAKEEYQDALEYFMHAEDSEDPETLKGHQKIDLGIQQSLCYRYLNQFDMAMLCLSKVINEGVVSNLRVKAMVLRAEIYEIQNRRELAQKQLEAAAKKGGEWSQVAKEKLVKDYGVN